MKTVLLEEMTWPQVRQAMAEGYTTVLIPAGSIEQHGRQLPLGMDAMNGELLGVAIARELGHTLVAPVIRPGCSDHHMAFPGTITVSPALLQEICRAYCRSLAHHGFQRLVLFASHGGNIRALAEVAPLLDAELPCRVVHANIFRDPRVHQALDAVLARYGATAEIGQKLMHAGFGETSLLLASRYAHLVDMPAAQPGYIGDHLARIKEVTVDGHWSMADITPVGVLGDPTQASAQAGRDLLAAVLPLYVRIVQEALAS